MFLTNKLLLNHNYVRRYSQGNEVQLVLPYQHITVDKPIVDSDQLNILVWNIYKQKRSECFDLLEKYANDISLFLLQEAQTTPQLLNFVTQYNKIADQVPAFSFNDIYAGVMTISDALPMTAASFKEKEPLIRIPKSALITEYRLLNDERTLLVVNVHAVNFSFGIKIYYQQIKILLARISQHQGPVILAGDFNSWSRKRLNLLYHLVHRTHLKAVNFSIDIRKTFLGRPLDFVFYRDLKMKNAEIVHTVASDHNPLLVNFQII